MSGLPRVVKVLLVVVAIQVAIIVGLVAGILAFAGGTALATAIAVGGGGFFTSLPVVLGIEKAIMS